MKWFENFTWENDGKKIVGMIVIIVAVGFILYYFRS